MTHSLGTALVTGAPSGIGAVYADRLANHGYDLVLEARNVGRLDAVAKRIKDATGRAIEVVPTDLNNKADLHRVETLLRTNPGITMLVNNAGVGALHPLLESDVDKMADMIELNVKALTRLTYAAAPAFVARGAGTIINISSAVAVWPELLNGVYAGTKAFVLALSLSLHKELAGKNVRIQAVLPGATATNFFDAAGGSAEQVPSEMMMSVDDLVDAALIGCDQGELVTIPSLPDAADWRAYEPARQKLIPNLSRSVPAARHRTTAAALTRIPKVLAFVGMIAACLWAWATVALAGSRSAVEDKAVYAPIESIRYDFGSKSMSGYFVEQAGACHVMLMVFETTDPDKSPLPSATRVRLVLLPGQKAGLDSEEGRSLNFTCGARGTTLFVDAGERDRLVNF